MTTDALTIPALAPPTLRGMSDRQIALLRALREIEVMMMGRGAADSTPNAYTTGQVERRAGLAPHIASFRALEERGLIEAVPHHRLDGLYALTEKGRAAIDAHLGKARPA